MTLIVNDLSFERNHLLLFRDIHFHLQHGEAIQIRGENGSGKSTLLRILAGFIEPNANTVHWDQRCILTCLEAYQSFLHYIGHLNGIKPYLTVYENLQLFNALYQLNKTSSDIHASMKRMDLYSLHNTLAITLSAGQKRRLTLATLLLRSSALWILDEPTTALDTEGQVIFTDMLQQHLQQGGSIILSTHHDVALKNPIKTLRLGK